MSTRPTTFQVGAGADRETIMTDTSSIGRGHDDADVDLELLQQRARIRQENIKLLERRLKGDPTLSSPAQRQRIRDDSSSVADSDRITDTASVAEEDVKHRHQR